MDVHLGFDSAILIGIITLIYMTGKAVSDLKNLEQRVRMIENYVFEVRKKIVDE